jgi:hypothetical protein
MKICYLSLLLFIILLFGSRQVALLHRVENLLKPVEVQSLLNLRRLRILIRTVALEIRLRLVRLHRRSLRRLEHRLCNSPPGVGIRLNQIVHNVGQIIN